MMAMIQSALAAIAQFLGFKKHRSELRNTPAMQKNAEAKDAEKERVEATKATEKAIKTGDLEEVRKRTSGGINLMLLAGLLLFGTGCASTVRPGRIQSDVVDYDGRYQDGGILGLSEGITRRFIVTEHVVIRFRSLVAMYGHEFNPPLVAGVGIEATGAVSKRRGPTYYMDPSSMVHYDQMVARARAGHVGPVRAR